MREDERGAREDEWVRGRARVRERMTAKCPTRSHSFNHNECHNNVILAPFLFPSGTCDHGIYDSRHEANFHLS